MNLFIAKDKNEYEKVGKLSRIMRAHVAGFWDENDNFKIIKDRFNGGCHVLSAEDFSNYVTELCAKF